MKVHPADRPLLIAVTTLVLAGFFIFLSASMGLVARDGGATFEGVVLKQFLIGIVGGVIAFFIFSRLQYRVLRKYAFYLFLGAFLLTLLVFIPGLGLNHGGATRWLEVGSFSFQPAEVLKVAFVIYLAAWLSGVKGKVEEVKFGMLPFLVLVGFAGVALLLQPDIGTLLIVIIAGTAMYLAAGAPWKHLLMLFVIGALAAGAVLVIKPYARERVMTFLDPSRDPRGSGYQIQQSLIAIGSGGMFVKGFGQSVQKFNFLPEPIGDAIFAVFAEEWGFVGAVALLGLFLFFALRGIKIAAAAPDLFGGLLALGIVILVVSQAFANIASMLGVFPLTGDPLPFVSQGGSAFLFGMAELGILANISRFRKAGA